jgi:hypothetical protein
MSKELTCASCQYMQLGYCESPGATQLLRISCFKARKVVLPYSQKSQTGKRRRDEKGDNEMKQMKILVLTAVAATALLAAVGASTASATLTSLCKKDTTTGSLPVCEEPHRYPAATTVHAALEGALVIESPLVKIVCEESTIQATTEQITAIPLGAIVEALTFGKCGGATLTTVDKGTLDIEIIDIPVWTHNGTLTFTGTKVKVVQLGLECVYSLGHAGILTGGAMATVDLSGNLTKVAGGFLCPAQNVKFNGSYTVTSPEPLWVSM